MSVVSPPITSVTSMSSNASSSVAPTTAAPSSVPPSTSDSLLPTSSSTPLTTSSILSSTSMSSSIASSTTPTSSQSPTSPDTSTVTTTTTSSTTSQSSATTDSNTTSLSQTTSSSLTITSSSPTTTASTTTSSSPTSLPSLATSTLQTTSSVPLQTSTSSPSSSRPSSTLPSTSSSSATPVPVVTTLESTVYITTTNAQGQPTTTAPSVVTEVTTSTNSAGAATTITVAAANPTLAPNSGTTSGSAFFRNTGAVVGVFLVVGLAATSIVLWIFFFIRRKRRINRIDHDTEVEAAVAASGFGRAPLDDDNDYRGARSPQSHSLSSAQMVQHGSPVGYIFDGSGLPTASQPVSGGAFDDDNAAFNPYAGYVVEGLPSNGGYMQARSVSPLPEAERQGPPSSAALNDIGDSSRDRKSSYGHTPTYSVASYEPLLAAYTQGSSAERGAGSPPTPPPRNPARRAHLDSVASRPANNSSDGGADDRLDPEIRRRTRSDSLGSDDLKDEEDYSRPVLTVRNMPDGRSINSAL